MPRSARGCTGPLRLSVVMLTTPSSKLVPRSNSGSDRAQGGLSKSSQHAGVCAVEHGRSKTSSGHTINGSARHMHQQCVGSPHVGISLRYAPVMWTVRRFEALAVFVEQHVGASPVL